MSYVKLICLIFIVFSLTSCASLFEDYSDAKILYEQGKYPEAINELKTFESSESKKLSARFHVDYAVSTLKNLETDRLVRYQEALKILRQAIKLDPRNKEARTYYLMVLKTMEVDYPQL